MNVVEIAKDPIESKNAIGFNHQEKKQTLFLLFRDISLVVSPLLSLLFFILLVFVRLNKKIKIAVHTKAISSVITPTII